MKPLRVQWSENQDELLKIHKKLILSITEYDITAYQPEKAP
jgi:hypothetical protein